MNTTCWPFPWCWCEGGIKSKRQQIPSYQNCFTWSSVRVLSKACVLLVLFIFQLWLCRMAYISTVGKVLLSAAKMLRANFSVVRFSSSVGLRRSTVKTLSGKRRPQIICYSNQKLPQTKKTSSNCRFSLTNSLRPKICNHLKSHTMQTKAATNIFIRWNVCLWCSSEW